MNTPAEQPQIITGIGGIVLCGGRSSRMGTPKHALPFGDETMLQRTVGIVSQVVQPVAVVKAPGMELPDLPADVIVTEDEQEGLGPLAGLAAGMNALHSSCRAAFATSCDVPLLKPAVIRFLAERLNDCDAVLFREGEIHHTLAAVYSLSLLDKVRALIAANRMRLLFLVQECHARIIDVNEVRHLDPERHSFRNVNTPDDYNVVLKLAQDDL